MKLDYRKIINQYRTVINNLISLIVLQGLNYLLPLITIPYLTRVLGPTNYGVIIFATSTILYFQILTDYGFNLSATRNISVNKENKHKISEIFSSVMIIKLMLLFLSFIIILFIIRFIPLFSENYKVYLALFLLLVGNVLFPIWLFQGMEEMKYITYINIILKGVSTVCIFIFIKNSNEYFRLALINGLASLFVGVISFAFAIKKFKIKAILPNKATIKQELRDGWYIFTTSFLSNVLANSGPFILGIFTNQTIVGYYGALDKITKAFVGMFAPITQAIFPHINKKFSISYEAGVNEVKRFGKIVISFSIVIAALMILFNKPIVKILCGEEYLLYANIVAYMSIWIVLSILNNFIGTQLLIGAGYGRYYSRSFVIAAISTIAIYIGLVKIISLYAIVAGTILGELILTIVMIYNIRHKIVD